MIEKAIKRCHRLNPQKSSLTGCCEIRELGRIEEIEGRELKEEEGENPLG